MPFLRRRGVMASESDMRRHTVFDNIIVPKRLPSQTGADSTSDIPAQASTSIDLPLESPSASSEIAPNDSTTSLGSHAATVMQDPLDRPSSPFFQSDSHKHRRFSILRFRNASDSQLAAKAKLQATSEKPPPLPRRKWPIIH